MLDDLLCVHAESAHQKGATDQVEAMARDLEFTRAELASAKQNLDKAHSDQSKVQCFFHFRTIGRRNGWLVYQPEGPCLQHLCSMHLKCLSCQAM